MLDLYSKNIHSSKPPISTNELNDSEVIEEIFILKKELEAKVTLLGHHYQNDEIIQFADRKGDSLDLARYAAETAKKEYIIFCGVHFMAETADILTSDKQKIILPDLNAGCTMADMANIGEVTKAWNYIAQCTEEKITPITYINCAANLKSFVGKNEGSICTSSNAKNVIAWGLENASKLFFFPDQHLGRNTCYELGISLDEMVVYDPNLKNGGLTKKQIQKAKVILWHGFCSVHQGFQLKHIQKLRTDSTNTKIVVHPECSFEIVQNADAAGSTKFIIDYVNEAPSGSSIAIGTEINLVNRLNALHEDKFIFSLSPYQCLCTTMYRVRPRWLLASLKAIKENSPINIIKVSEQDTHYAKLALNRMFELSK